ncbi:MAG: RMD1 family protein [Gammaproteobacteria bacterium]
MPLFNNKTAIRARALLLGERLDLKPLRNAEQLAAQPLTLPIADQGCVVLFRYGAAVLFDVPPMQEVAFLDHVKPLLADPLPEPEIETLGLHVAPDGEEGSFERDQLYLQDAGLERLQIIADVLAKSVVLAEYERRVADTFDRIEPLATRLERSGRVGFRAGELIRHTGRNLLVMHRMVGRVEVGEKPDALWERPDLERLYLRLEDEFELRERQLALHRKLEVIGQTVETVLDLLQTRRSLRVEWYIVVLIVAEIILSLYEMFWHGTP